MRTRADDIAQQYRQLRRRLKAKARKGRVNERERIHIMRDRHQQVVGHPSSTSSALTGINLGLTLTAIRTLEARLVEVKV